MEELRAKGWEPGMYWAAGSPEDQATLDVRYKAEAITDRAELYCGLVLGRRLKEGVALLDATDDDFEEVPQEPYDREKSIQETMVMLKAHEDYHNRPMQAIVRDSLTYIEMAQNDGDKYSLRHSLGREAWYVLRRAGEGDGHGVDSELVDMLTKWSSLELFSYHYWRDWDDMTVEDFKEIVTKAGIGEEEFEKLVKDPLTPEVAQELGSDAHYERVMAANEAALEKQMLQRAKEVNFEFGKVHGYGNYLTAWGV